MHICCLPIYYLSLTSKIECNLSNRHSHELVFVVVADVFFIVKQGHSIFCYNIDIKCTFLISFIVSVFQVYIVAFIHCMISYSIICLISNLYYFAKSHFSAARKINSRRGSVSGINSHCKLEARAVISVQAFTYHSAHHHLSCLSIAFNI